LGKLIDQDDEDIVNPIDRAAKEEEKVKALSRLSLENEPKVKEFLEKLDRKYGTESKMSFKAPEKILEKASRPSIRARKPWHDVEHVRDSFRFKTVLENIEQLPQIAEDLKKAGFTVIKTDTNKVLRPGFWGWRIAAFDLKMPNGQLVEYYLPLKELEEAKKNGNHELFEKWRNEDPETMSKEKQKEYLSDAYDSYDKYEGAWQKYLERTKQKPEQVKAALEAAEKVFEKDRAKQQENKMLKKSESKLIRKIKERKEKAKEDDLLR
jgi:hypothetical protein